MIVKEYEKLPTKFALTMFGMRISFDNFVTAESQKERKNVILKQSSISPNQRISSYLEFFTDFLELCK